MELLDWLVVGIYFVGLLGLTWWVVRQNKDTTDDCFLAGRNLGWLIVGASITSTGDGSPPQQHRTTPTSRTIR